MTAVVGFFGTAMIAVLIAKLVGYASGCVGSLCSWVRQEDRATCILYTQLANPTSNAIYRRLGFEAVAEVLSYRFRPGSPASSVSR